jgi:uncharacterized protein YukE
MTDNEGNTDDPSGNLGNKDKNSNPNNFNGSTNPPPNGTPSYQSNTPPPPTVPDNSGSNGQNISVSPDAMRTFAANLEQLEQVVASLIKEITGVNVTAGSFSTAVNLAQKIDAATSGLTDTTNTVLTDLMTTITDTVAAARKLAADFDNAEDLNGLTADNFNRYINQVSSDVNNLNSALGNSSNSSSK